MPYPSEHAARQNEPGKYKKMRRENDAMGKGIHVIWGVLENGKTEVQSLRFDKDKFTVAEAKAWLKDHDYKTEVEPATSKASEFAEINDLEIFEAGTWNGDTYTQAQLKTLVDQTNDLIASGKHEPPLKLGHNEMQALLGVSGLAKDGLPAIGWVKKLKLVGNKILAYVKDVPKVIADLINKGAYKKVSCEIYIDDLILKAIGLLGADLPAVKGLDGFNALYETNGVEFVGAYNNDKVYKEYEYSKEEVSDVEGELIRIELLKNLPKKIYEEWKNKKNEKLKFFQVLDMEQYLMGYQIVIIKDMKEFDPMSLYYKDIFPGVAICIGKLLGAKSEEPYEVMAFKFDRYLFTEAKVKEWLNGYEVKSFKEIKIEGGEVKMTEQEKADMQKVVDENGLLKGQVATLTTQIKTFTDEKEKGVKAAKEGMIKTFVDSAIKDGKIAPAQEVMLNTYLSGLKDEAEVKGYVEKMPKIMLLTETDSADNTEEKKGSKDFSDAEIDIKVKAYQEKHAGLSYREAFDAIVKEFNIENKK